MFQQQYRPLWFILLLSLGIVLLLLFTHKSFLLGYIFDGWVLIIGGCYLYLYGKEIKRTWQEAERGKRLAQVFPYLLPGFMLYQILNLRFNNLDIQFHPTNWWGRVSNVLVVFWAMFLTPLLALSIIVGIGLIRSVLYSRELTRQTQNRNMLEETDGSDI